MIHTTLTNNEENEINEEAVNAIVDKILTIYDTLPLNEVLVSLGIILGHVLSQTNDKLGIAAELLSMASDICEDQTTH